MLEVTTAAMEMCSATVRQLSGADSNTKCLRFIRRDEGVSISFEVPRSDDRIVLHDGLAVIAIPKAFASMLAARTLDLGDDGRLVITASPSTSREGTECLQ